MRLDDGVVVEGHAGNHMQVVAPTVLVDAGSGAIGDLLEDVDRPIVFVALRLHVEAIAADHLAVQRACARYGAHTRALTTAILHLLIHVDIVRSHSGETA